MGQTAPSKPVALDLNAPSFQGVTIPLFMLLRANLEAGRGVVIEDRTFRDCIIEGPAVLLPVDACNFDNCDFGSTSGDIRNLILRPEGARVTGAIAMTRCLFFDCRFVAIGFTGHDNFIRSLLQTTVKGN
jgi:hypothetical protein